MKLTKLICGVLAFTSLSVFADNDDALATLAVQRANFSLEQAVAKVSSDYAAQIVELEIDEHKMQAVYEIEAYNIDKQEKYKVELSLEDGSVLKEKKKSIKLLGMNRLDDDEQFALQELQKSEFKLAETIVLLQKKYSADIFEFELENKKGITFYKFKLMGEQGSQKAIVDVQTGKIIPMIKH